MSFGANSDQTVLYLQEGATKGIDQSFDALKLTGGDMNIYTSARSTNYSIQALPATSDTFSVSLQMTSNYKGSHLLTATEFNSGLNSELYHLIC